jgi:hypothetical protein
MSSVVLMGDAELVTFAEVLPEFMARRAPGATLSALALSSHGQEHQGLSITRMRFSSI